MSASLHLNRNATDANMYCIYVYCLLFFFRDIKHIIQHANTGFNKQH